MVITVFSSCRKENLTTDSSARLAFSEDTLVFDTVFTTVGSVTKYFRVYNNHKNKIRISSISLEKGANSNFRLNVDGVPGTSFTDIEIEGEDSIFIFVEVTVDPNNGTNPLIITDSIIFETNGNSQGVALVAWGQDAYFYTPGPGQNAYVLPCNLSLANDKPHVFYGYAIVDSACCLTIPAGTKLHFHPNSGLIVYKGCLNAQGTTTSPVIIQGDRLEYAYSEIAGQWDGIHFIGAQNSLLEHTVIKNGYYGLWCDTSQASNLVELNAVEIRNMASLGLYANAGASIKGVNCLVKNCGMYCLAATYGMTLDFNHCTFANYWTEEDRSSPAVYMTNWFTVGATEYVRPVDINFTNCIIYGDKDNEFRLDFHTGSTLNFIFSDCFIRTDGDVSDLTHYSNISKNVYPQFVDVALQNFRLQSSSPCRDAASGNLPEDIEGTIRVNPDIGCYEYE